LQFDAGGRVLVAASACTTNLNDNSCDVVALRYTSSGASDSSWGKSGVVTTDFDGGVDRGFGVALQPRDGKVVVAGTTEKNGTSDFALARYIP
jgi:hypothetical protein